MDPFLPHVLGIFFCLVHIETSSPNMDKAEVNMSYTG